MRFRFPALLLFALCFATSVAAQVAERARTGAEARAGALRGAVGVARASCGRFWGCGRRLRPEAGWKCLRRILTLRVFRWRNTRARWSIGCATAMARGSWIWWSRPGMRRCNLPWPSGPSFSQACRSLTALVERHQLAGQTLPPDVNGAFVFYDFRGTVELALKLQPGVRDAVCVFGTTVHDRQVGQEALAALAKHPELHVRQLDTTPYAEILEQVRHLSAESIVFYVNIQRDARGTDTLSDACRRGTERGVERAGLWHPRALARTGTPGWCHDRL